MTWDKEKEAPESNERGDAPASEPVRNTEENGTATDKRDRDENEEYTDVLESGLGIDE